MGAQPSARRWRSSASPTTSTPPLASLPGFSPTLSRLRRGLSTSSCGSSMTTFKCDSIFYENINPLHNMMRCNILTQLKNTLIQKIRKLRPPPQKKKKKKKKNGAPPPKKKKKKKKKKKYS